MFLFSFALLVDRYDTCPSWERSHTAVRELYRLIPNFQKRVDEGSPEEIKEFFAQVGNIFLLISIFMY
jgi:hypothetical protein